jgi:mono/diheme cytochrome c family protein
MFEVVHLSTQYMVPEDVEAMTTYLMGDKPLAPQPFKVTDVAGPAIDAGRRTYVAVCAGCHGLDGGGKPHVAVAMKGNSSVRNSDAHNLIAVTLDGIAARHFGDMESMQEMPGFAGKLTDKDAADLLTYMRATWGAAASVSEAQVKAIRDEASHRP